MRARKFVQGDLRKLHMVVLSTQAAFLQGMLKDPRSAPDSIPNNRFYGPRHAISSEGANKLKLFLKKCRLPWLKNWRDHG